jgi:hypothetical protein
VDERVAGHPQPRQRIGFSDAVSERFEEPGECFASSRQRSGRPIDRAQRTVVEADMPALQENLADIARCGWHAVEKLRKQHGVKRHGGLGTCNAVVAGEYRVDLQPGEDRLRAHFAQDRRDQLMNRAVVWDHTNSRQPPRAASRARHLHTM